MVVATIPLRDWALSIEPSWDAILAGILFHQWADFTWAIAFFGLLGRYWIGLMVHVSSASMYPLFPFIRDRMPSRRGDRMRQR